MQSIDYSKDETKEELFEFGSELLVYGSKKIYKKYCLFRIISTPRITSCIFYSNQLPLFIATDIFNQIRKEIGLNNFEASLKFDAICFYVNDLFYDKKSRHMWIENKIRLLLVIAELRFK